MTIPSTSIYVRPGWNSYTWTYGGATATGASGSSTGISAVAFSLDSNWGQQVARGDFQYSLDGGQSWTTYLLPTDSDGQYLPAAGTLWRFADHSPDDSGSPGSFTMHWQLADGSVASSSAAVVADDQPVGLTDDHVTLFSTMHAGDAVASLAPIDTGAPNGGRWVIEGQSQAGLFSVAADPVSGAATLVVANPGAMPAVGDSVTVDMHYYDRYQVDSNGNPIAATGVTGTLVFTVLPGATQDLAAFGPDLTLGAAAGSQAAPALASLSGGGFAAVWQGSDAALWAQLRDAGGNPIAAPFQVTPANDAASEAEPAVGALAGGAFVVAYTVQQDGASSVAYRIVEANGSVGQQLAAGTAGDGAMPTVATLADGSFVIGWRSAGQVHLLHADAHGAVLGAEQTAGSLGTAFSPSITALHNGDYVVSWGEGGDGNVYAALGSALAGAPLRVTSDGAAASVSTAAPLPHVAALAGGGFVVAWDSYSNDPRGFTMSDIFFQRYDNAGNALGQPVQANMDSGAGRYDASLAALPDGGFVLAWQAQGADGDANGVFGRRFGADGSAIDGHEFQVNQQAQGDQANPALAAFANGGFAAAWTDSQQGLSTIEVRVLAGSAASGGADSGQGSGSGSLVTPQPVPTPAPAVPTQPLPPQLLAGTDGANVFTSFSGSHAIDGGAGLDTVLYQGAHTSFTVKAGAAGVSVSGVDGAVHDTLVNVERLQFSDATVALDVGGAAGQAYRLYQAAFDRAPDPAGLGYWIKALDAGASLDQAAAGFVTSKEFADLYGAGTSDSQFVQALYQNVLHRPAEAAGYDFWIAALGQSHVAREQVLSHFSESGENQVQVIGAIQDGIVFLPWA